MEKQKKDIAFRKFYLKIFKDNWFKFVSLLIIMLMSTGISIGMASLYMILVDNITAGIFNNVLLLGIAYFLVNCINYAASTFSTYYNQKICNHIDIKIKNEIFNVLLKQDGNKVSNTDSAEYTSLMMNDSNKVSELINSLIFPATLGIFRVIGMVIFLAIVQWKILIMVVIVQPIMFITQKKIKERMGKYSEDNRENIVGFFNAIKEYTSNLFKIIILGKNEYFKSEFNEKLVRSKNSELKMLILDSFNEGLVGVINIAPMIILLIYGGYQVSVGEMTVGAVLLYVQYYQSLFSPLTAIFETIISFESFKPSIKKVIEVLSTKPNGGDIKNISENSAISVQNVSFGYSSERKILENVNLNFDFGKTYGIYGESGCGKSTLCSLILGFWQPTSGNIKLGDVNINEINQEILFRNITYLSQDSYLLNESIYNNVVLGEDCSKDKFYEIMEKVNLLDFILDLPEKENTIVGDNGVLLSGGQKKRIELARVLFNKTPILILDEPTTGLDDKNAIDIMQTFMKEYANSIIIIISHQMEIVEMCDHIYDVKNNILRR